MGHHRGRAAGSIGKSIVAVVAVAVILTGCGNGSKTSSSTTSTSATTSTTPTTAPSSTSSSTATSVPPSTAEPTTSVAASTIPAEGSQAGFDAALAQWKIGAAAISAGQGQYWTQAKADLQTGRTTDSPTTGYASAISELAQLISLPDADMTPNPELRVQTPT
jgi:cytoskeletal protein RodZ